jgi:cell wall-associated NlpC family hydrolase
MRAFPLAWRGLVFTVVLAIASTTSANADKPSVGELQVRLVEVRQHLNSLYAQSAVASERLNGATYELQQSRAALARHRADLATAKRKLTAQRAAVAELTVEQLQSGSSALSLLTMFDSNGPAELLERASAYSSTSEAMAARMDALAARQVVYDAAAREAEAAIAAQRKAEATRKAAQAAIDDAIARARAAVSATTKERKALLRQLAAAQGSTVREVTHKQDGIDRHLDEAGPDLPTSPPPAGPRPTTPRPTTPAPTTPPPADPPPASSSKVETAIAFAKAQLGEPYEWGAAGPSSWDCSGLTMRAWQAAGVSLPHYAGSQYALTRKVAVSDIRRGDLLYWSDGGASSIYHVALYLGGGQMIQAPRPGRDVEIVPLSYWIRPDLASRPG